ncbi:NAD-dependent epimerase/dehydratase family protein [Paenibacillus guangzhouensis]|uniref:NAD-dependent epimerase/dehydratase family protein n=1 Tax=Paenibacillus guangzhouensis TaxID=1473112 RepID=UPI001266E71A|nr:NAD(P)-dependent oxidoreductase [Paenibacillus guangzhouensis]
MRILVTGASGVIGRNLIPLLVKDGHVVGGMVKSAASERIVAEMQAEPFVVDAFLQEDVDHMFQVFQPDVVIHQITALRQWNTFDNAHVRIEGTKNIVDAAKRVHVKRIVAQSISWAYEAGDAPATEDTALDLSAAEPRKTTIDGIVSLEQKVTEIPEYVILRNGALYGPGTWYAADGSIADKVRKREMTATDGVTSFVHVQDAVNAIMLALDWESGIFNIVDDMPVPGNVWIPAYAKLIGADEPAILQGRSGIERGASNAKARRLGWSPVFPTWEDGFKDMLLK